MKQGAVARHAKVLSAVWSTGCGHKLFLKHEAGPCGVLGPPNISLRPGKVSGMIPAADAFVTMGRSGEV